MPRRKISDIKQESAALQVEQFANVDRKKQNRSLTPKRINKEIEKISKRIENDDWEDFRSGELVALYAWCHNEVYGVMPGELDGVWKEAKYAAGNMVRREFGNDAVRAVKFFKWLWAREEGRVKWKINKGIQITRISWKAVFVHRYLITDYNVAGIVHEKNSRGYQG